MKAVLAISGGVDSMVMLNMLQFDDVVVAHFDHGIRESSEDDMLFVKRVAMDCNLEVVTDWASLGAGTSEEVARSARYEFLRKVADKYGGAEIYTAHHLDDLVESVAINLIRGTGWRGLAVLDTPGIRRPFLESEYMTDTLRDLVPFDKKRIQTYAADFEVDYRQDSTNNEDTYLRNRLRKKLGDFRHKKELYELWQEQKRLKQEIDSLAQELLPAKGGLWQRDWFVDLDEKVALELLRAGTLRAGISATRPQLEDFRQAILNYAPGKFFNLPGDKLVKLTKTAFVL